MAAIQAHRADITVFQIGTSVHSPIATNHALCMIEQDWRQARKQSMDSSKIASDIQISMYSAADVELQFQQRSQGPEHVPPLWVEPVTWDASNPVALDEIAPQELYSALKQGLSWDEYVHIFSMGAHEFILKEQVDKTLVVN
ncbi:hypothetical protein BGZ74_009740 [Mortierella antarctica]|nr:hypothetical protein BGZ74_009740 [Mortierella antarctica]